ncbi:MAG: helix-turn-helix domain-containing protein [Betaproteobacteria bacterium]|nr:helix-turn-helix domain-containing protein [Betaproteobacteria bacterium]
MAIGELGPTLRALRKGKKLSQASFGKLVGLSQERISRIESDPESVSLDQLLTIMMVLGARFVVRTNEHDSPQETGGDQKDAW